MSFVARLSTRLLPLKQAVSRALSHVFPRLNYLIWAWRNPGKNFKTFYAESITAALEGRKKHASLGPTLKDDRNEVALRTFKQLIAQGISPNDTDVDYGCGTLRLGRTFIAFLYARCGKESSVLSSKSWKHDIRQLQENAALHGMALDAPTRTRKFLRLQTLGAALLSMLQLFGADFADIVLLSV